MKVTKYQTQHFPQVGVGGQELTAGLEVVDPHLYLLAAPLEVILKDEAGDPGVHLMDLTEVPQELVRQVQGNLWSGLHVAL